MNHYQFIENIYYANNLTGLDLINTNDLLKVHGINIMQIPGFKQLDKDKQEIFEDFIINFFNTFGVETRCNIIPISVYFVQEKNYLIKENEADNYFQIQKVEVSTKINGEEKIIKRHDLEKDQHQDVLTIEISHYLRFDYYYYNREEWQHVIGPTEWY